MAALVPDSCLARIVSWLRDPADVENAALVCRRWRYTVETYRELCWRGVSPGVRALPTERSNTTLFVWGSGLYYMLGMPTTEDRLVPVELSFFRNRKIRQVASGGFCSAVLLDTGSLYVFGDNSFHQHAVEAPEVVPGITLVSRGKVASMNFGFAYLIVRLFSGSLVSWGTTEFGTLLHDGQQPTLDSTRVHPSSQPSSSFALRKGSLPCDIPKQLLQGHVLTQISCGDTMVMAVADDGIVVAWGSNAAGRLGIGLTEQTTFGVVRVQRLPAGIKQVACGGAHTLALASSGAVYSWGSGGCSSITPSLAVTGGPARLGHGEHCTHFASSEAYPCLPFPLQIEGVPPVAEVACGQWHSFVVADGAHGGVFAFGGNSFGQCGLDTAGAPVYLPTRVTALDGLSLRHPGGIHGGRLHSAAVTADGHLYTFGRGPALGTGVGVSTSQPTPTLVSALQPFVVEQLALGKFVSLAVVSHRK
eukprot:TRINITY_DN6731_c0_g1_i1.p1 TRINITY_DN6731_c0_g1~~TRINITY_DN6731_c0_g1_i1.p1  ORF type:complete len:483 (+),score=51.39 TRINITY_DN6731_c0_g1_i1:25-1449(+)